MLSRRLTVSLSSSAAVISAARSLFTAPSLRARRSFDDGNASSSSPSSADDYFNAMFDEEEPVGKEERPHRNGNTSSNTQKPSAAASSSASYSEGKGEEEEDYEGEAKEAQGKRPLLTDPAAAFRPANTVIIRNLPPDWGKTEVASFVMDALGSDASPIELPLSFIEDYAAQMGVKRNEETGDFDVVEDGDGDENGNKKYFTSLSSSTFGTVSTVTDANGVSLTEGQWYPIQKVVMLYSSQKGTTLRKALVTFNPYLNFTGVVGAIRPEAMTSNCTSEGILNNRVGVISDQFGANHPLVRKMLRTDPEQVAPGINAINRRYGKQQRLVKGSGLVEILLQVDKRLGMLQHPDDRSKWADKDRILWEANHPEEALATLDIDRFLMSPDLLYDFERMKQEKYVPEANLKRQIKEGRGKAIAVRSFLPSTASARGGGDGGDDEDDEASDPIGTDVGRGSPANLRVPAPYVDNLRR